MRTIKQIDLKNRTYHFFNDIILNEDLLKMDKKSYKNIDIYYIEYIAIKNVSD